MRVGRNLIGRQVRVQAVKPEGSARFLHGLVGRVIAEHAIARNWVVVALDPNARTNYREWSIPAERLVVIRRGR